MIEGKGKDSNSSDDCSISDIVRVSVLVCIYFSPSISLRISDKQVAYLLLDFVKLEFSRPSWL